MVRNDRSGPGDEDDDPPWLPGPEDDEDDYPDDEDDYPDDEE